MNDKIDIEKVKAAVSKLRISGGIVIPQSLDMGKVNKLGREMIGQSGEIPRRVPSYAAPVDGAIRSKTSKVAKGCKGFNHPHFHP